ncbi:hypothetical protein VNI00_010777 [Paramarasmius palmivorus]|uniref:Uncharacterized protein n=1 Tax=Paramarasmius palmivorus TaxID=297713 RepID=A0AAW0CF86_9AGAR
MVPHLQNVLKTLPPSVVMSGIFGQWKYLMWEEATASEIQLRLKTPATFFRSRMERLRRHFGIWWAPGPDLRQPALHHREGIALLFYDQYWTAMAHKADLRVYWSPFLDSIKKAYPHLQRTTTLRFVIPFPILEALWVHDDPPIRSQSLHLLRFLEDSWRPLPSLGYDETRHDQERIAFVSALTRHLNRTDHTVTSVLMTSRRGQQFIRFVNLQIIHRRFYSTQLSHRSQASFRDRSILMLEWARATRRVQEVGNLPLDHFAPIPAPEDDSPASSEGANESTVRYSVDTATPEVGSNRLAMEESSPDSSTPRDGNLSSAIADGSVTQGEYGIV